MMSQWLRINQGLSFPHRKFAEQVSVPKMCLHKRRRGSESRKNKLHEGPFLKNVAANVLSHRLGKCQQSLIKEKDHKLQRLETEMHNLQVEKRYLFIISNSPC